MDTETKTKAALAGAGAVLTAVVVVAAGTDLLAIDVQKEVALEPSKLALLTDAKGNTRKGYVALTKLVDGGSELREVAPGCVMRPTKAPVITCQRRISDPQGRILAMDQGELTRFSLTEAVGAGCVPVACSVFLGDDSLKSEDVRIQEAVLNLDSQKPEPELPVLPVK